MARATGAPVPVMADDTKAGASTGSGARATGADTKAAAGAKGAASASATDTKTTAAYLGGPWGASFDGTNGDGSQVKGLSWDAPLHAPGHPPLRRDRVGAPDRRDLQRDRQDRLRAEGRRGPQGLEPARDQRRRQQVLPRPRRDAGAGAQRQAAHRPRRQHASRPGRRPSTTSRRTRTSSAFQAELTHLLVHQKMAFNSPVWFNVGIEPKPQCSACFINSVQDNMGSIMDLAKTEAMLFKFGSGAGSNLSPIRSSKERMSGGGIASGPGQLHEGLRRVRRRHQVGRQDPPRGQDGHPRRGPSRTSSSSSTRRCSRRRRPGR